MKNNKNKLGKTERFKKNLETALNGYYHKTLSDNAKRAWQKRKQLSTIGKVAM